MREAVGGPGYRYPDPQMTLRVHDIPSPSPTALLPAESLCRAVRASRLAVGLLHLPQRRFAEMSERAKELLGLEAVDLPEFDVLMLSADPGGTALTWNLIADGVLDAYAGRRRMRVRGKEMICNISVRVVARGEEKADSPSAQPDPRVTQSRQSCCAVVTFDLAGELEAAPNPSPRAAAPSGEYTLTSLLDIVHPGEVTTILDAFERVMASGQHVTVRVRCRSRGGAQAMQVVLRRVDGDPPSFGYAVRREDDGGLFGLGNSELERRLQHISEEIQAIARLRSVGHAPDPDRIHGLRDLTPRQWEIVTRLLRGERVPTIARTMYLSQSTVRNHLSGVFRKVGVSSQEELIAALQRRE